MDNTKQAPMAVPKAKPKKRRGASLDKKKARYGWWFIAPFLIGFAVVYLPMIVQSVYFSFCKINPVTGGGYTTEWVGWENYSYALFEDPSFLTHLGSSILDLLFDIPAIVVFSLFMAIMLNQDMKGRAVFRAIFFIPVIVSTGIIDSIDAANSLAEMQGQLGVMGDAAESGMSGMTGVSSNMGEQIIDLIDVQKFFGNMMVGRELVAYVTNMANGVYQIINRAGVQMLIFLAGLQSISPSIYESAYMEGASSWETFWKITFPMISPMILVNTIYTVIDSFTNSSNTVMSYISSVYSSGKNTASTAMSWMYFLIIIVILAIIAGILSAYVFYQRRD